MTREQLGFLSCQKEKTMKFLKEEFTIGATTHSIFLIQGKALKCLKTELVLATLYLASQKTKILLVVESLFLLMNYLVMKWHSKYKGMNIDKKNVFVFIIFTEDVLDKMRKYVLGNGVGVGYSKFDIPRDGGYYRKRVLSGSERRFCFHFAPTFGTEASFETLFSQYKFDNFHVAAYNRFNFIGR